MSLVNKESKTVLIIQARMNSQRLPGKVLLPLANTTVLGVLLERVKAAKFIDKVVVATSTDKADDPICLECDRHNVTFFRGSEYDVLSRYFAAASLFEARFVVRICADSPLIDPCALDELCKEFKKKWPKVKYGSNRYEPSYPKGLDIEIFDFEMLRQAALFANEIYEREHVTPFIMKKLRPSQILSLKSDVNNSDIRVTIDEPDDYLLVKQVVDNLGLKKCDTEGVIRFLRENPSLMSVNCSVKQKDCYEIDARQSIQEVEA